jgi:hypothetical protein
LPMSSRAFHGPSMLATTLLDNQSTTYVILKNIFRMGKSPYTSSQHTKR